MTVAEVLVGVLGLLILLLPVIDNFTFEGLGIKATAKLRTVAETAETNAALIGNIEVRLAELEKANGNLKGLPSLQPSSTNGTISTPAISAGSYVNTIIYGEGRREEAAKIRDKLIGDGFPASIVATDFSELKEPLPSGAVRIVYKESAKAVLDDLGKIVASLVGSAHLTVNPNPSTFSTGQVQIQLF